MICLGFKPRVDLFTLEIELQKQQISTRRTTMSLKRFSTATRIFRRFYVQAIAVMVVPVPLVVCKGIQ